MGPAGWRDVMADETWTSVALPLLEQIGAHEADAVMAGAGALAAELGLDIGLVNVELERLMGDGYIDADQRVEGFGSNKVTLLAPRLTGVGARAIGKWPSSDPYDALLNLLDERILDPHLDEETKTKLARLRSTIVDVGKGATGGVLAALIRGAIGL